MISLLSTIVGLKIRMIVICFAGLLACVLPCRAEERKDPTPELAFKLRDSSFVRGVATIERMPFQSALGKVDVPLVKLRTVEFKDDRKSAVLSFQNGDRLEGVIHLNTIGLKTAYGKLEVELCEITSIQVSEPPTSAGSVSAEGLVGHWHLDGDAKDVSGHSRHGKIIGATPTQGVSGGAYHFDGNAGIDLGPLDFSSGQFTVSGWIRTDEPAQTDCWRIWISKLDESGGPFELSLGDGRRGPGFTADGPLVSVWNDGRGIHLFNDNSKLSLRDGRWHMYSFTHQKGGQKIYIDGKLVVSRTSSEPLPSTSASVRIGGHRFGPSHHPWIGDVDEVLIYSRVLGSDEVMQLFQTQRPVNTPNQP